MKKTKLNRNKETKKGEVFTRKLFWWHIVNSDTGRQNCCHKLRKGQEIAEIKGRQTKSHLFPPSAPQYQCWVIQNDEKYTTENVFNQHWQRGERGVLFFPSGGSGGVIFSFSFLLIIFNDFLWKMAVVNALVPTNFGGQCPNFIFTYILPGSLFFCSNLFLSFV